jgi:hypothetical protein
MLGGIKLPSAPSLASIKNVAAKGAPSLSTIKAAAPSLNTLKTAASKAVTSGNIKGTMMGIAKTAGENAAVATAASQIPGGANAVKLAKSLGIPSSSILAASSGAPGMLNSVKNFFTTMDTKTMLILSGVGGIFLLLLVGLILFFTQKKASNFQNVANTSIVQGSVIQDAAAALGSQVKGLTGDKAKTEGFANATGSPPAADDVKLINIQPLTIKEAGFIGPLAAGVFQEATAVTNTLKAGVRTFFFQIDYHEDPKKDTKLFPSAKEPCLLYRDDNGVLTSTNAGSILKMSQAIADIGFSDAIPSKTDPIVIVLYGARVPSDPITDPKGYLAYCSKIAKQLKPLAPFHLGMTTNGDYHRQALQGQLFTTPFKNFEKKVIIISNFDTTLYRNVQKMGITAYAPAEDLDYWTHAQIFKDDPGLEMAAPKLGITSVAATTASIRSKIYTIDSLRAVIKGGPAAISAWATKNKGIFTIVMPNMMTNPSYIELETLVKKMGVNVIPLDIFSFPVDETKRLVHIWDSKTWNLRPMALRATK